LSLPRREREDLPRLASLKGAAMTTGRRVRWIAIVAVTPIALVGCGSSGGSKSSPTTVGSAATQQAASGSSTSAAGATPTTAASNALQMMVSGTVGGVPVDGPVSGGTVSCVPVGSASQPSVEVQWSGEVPSGAAAKSVAFDASIGVGTHQLSEGGGSLVVNGDYKDRVGGTSGTITLNPDKKSGSIDGVLSYGTDHATVKGTWTCP
jgi:hypothetical protein